MKCFQIEVEVSVTINVRAESESEARSFACAAVQDQLEEVSGMVGLPMCDRVTEIHEGFSDEDEPVMGYDAPSSEDTTHVH